MLSSNIFTCCYADGFGENRYSNVTVERRGKKVRYLIEIMLQ